MRKRDVVALQIAEALFRAGAVNVHRRLTLLEIGAALKDDDRAYGDQAVSLRYVRELLASLTIQQVVSTWHDRPPTFYLTSRSALSDLRRKLSDERNVVCEAHEHDETQLPSFDSQQGADLDLES